MRRFRLNHDHISDSATTLCLFLDIWSDLGRLSAEFWVDFHAPLDIKACSFNNPGQKCLRPLPPPPFPPNSTQGHPMAPKHRQRDAIPSPDASIRLSKNLPLPAKGHVAFFYRILFANVKCLFSVGQLLPPTSSPRRFSIKMVAMSSIEPSLRLVVSACASNPGPQKEGRRARRSDRKR